MATEYYPSKTAPNGIEARCKVCYSVKQRKYRSYEDWFWKRFWKRVERVGECLEWKGTTSRGYPECTWKKKQTSLRRIIYSLAIGGVPDDMFVLSTCNNKRCVSQYHMRLATKEERNVKLCNSKATGDRNGMRLHPDRKFSPQGSRNPCAKLNEDKARDARLRVLSGESQRSVARTFGVSHATIQSLIKGKTWKHVQ